MQQQKKASSIEYFTQNIQMSKGLKKGLDAESFNVLMLNEKIYFIECYSISPGKYQNLYVYHLATKQWQSLTTDIYKFNRSNPYFLKHGNAWATIKNNLFVFGGKDVKDKLDNQLASLNLTHLMWKTDYDIHVNKQSYPQGRAGATLLAFKQSHLILYGGKTALQFESTKFFWIFSLANSSWSCIQSPVNVSVHTPFLCLQNQNIYILSRKNQFQTSSIMHRIHLTKIKSNDSLELKLECEKMQNHRQCQIQYLSKDTKFKMFPLSQNFILISQLNTIHNQAKNSLKIWLLDAMCNQLQLTNINIQSSAKQVLQNENKNQFYYLKANNRFEQILKLKIGINQLECAKNQLRYKQWRNCQICFETLKNQNKLMESAFKLHINLISSVTQKVRFPFAVLGLLADNYLTHSASYMNIRYYTYKQTEILKIQDDNHSNLSNEQLEEVIVNFEAEINYHYNSVERRSRYLRVKDFYKKQLGVNLKMAALRLGTQMLYVSVTSSGDVRVAWFGIEDDEYVCHFYVIDQKTGKLYQDYSIESQLFIQSKYLGLINQNIIRSTTSKQTPNKHALYVIGLKKIYNENGELISQLQPSDYRVDILNKSSNTKVYDKWSQFGSKISESIDVSLVSYLSMLFLKNEAMKISVQVFDGQKKYIHKEEMFDHLDRVSWSKCAIPINSELASFDMKHLDLVLNNKMNKRIGIFANGILLYQRNKLIKRFGCQLGELLDQLQLVSRPSYQYFNIFGTIELPDAVQVNQQKTDFNNPMMLEKLYSKLMHLHKIFNLHKNYQYEEAKSISHKENLQKMKLRRVQQPDANAVPRKKVKRLQEDESYSAN